MESVNDTENGDICLVAISVPISKNDNSDKELRTFYDTSSVECPAGMQLVSMNEVYVETTYNETEETIGFVLNKDANCQYFYASEETEGHILDIYSVPESEQVCIYDVNDECQGNVDDRNVRHDEENDAGDEQYTLVSDTGQEQYILENVIGQEQYIIENGTGDEQYAIKNEAADKHYTIENDVAEDQYTIENGVAEDQYTIENDVAEDQYTIENDVAEDQYIIENDVSEEQYTIENEQHYALENGIDEEQYTLENVTDEQQYVLENTETVNGVYVLREENHEDISEHQEIYCDNVLQDYGYAFVDEADKSSARCDEDERVDVETLGEVVSAFKCASCNFTTLDKTALVQHHSQVHCCAISDMKKDYVKNSERVVYICGQCSIEMPSIDACKHHMITAHKLLGTHTSKKKCNETDAVENGEINVNSQRNQCEEDDTNKPIVDERLREYWLQHGTSKNVKARLCSDRKIRCTMKKCLYRFSTRDKMLQHESCHSETGVAFSCPLCEARYPKWPQCSLHLHNTHSVSLDIITCPLCANHFTHSVRLMSRHLQKHSEEKDAADGKHDLRWYSRKTCHLCHKTFGNSKILNAHIKFVHHKLKPFKCSICGHPSSKRSMLKLHMRQHTGDKPYQCEFCHYKTGDHNTLHKHRKIHTKERPYSCPVCPYACIQIGSLKSHIKSRHPTYNANQDSSKTEAPS